jgi:hypothetical protein
MPLLRLDFPHLDPLHLALPAGLAAHVALQQMLRLHFPVAAKSLALLSSGTMRASVVEGAAALIGCFKGPAGEACVWPCNTCMQCALLVLWVPTCGVIAQLPCTAQRGRSGMAGCCFRTP